MQMSTTFVDQILSQVASTSLWISLHTNDPGTTGAYEVDVAPYVRSPISWATPVAGALANSTLLAPVLPAGVPAFFFGVWTEVIGGDFWWGGPLVPPGASGIVFPADAPVVFDPGAFTVALP